MTRTHTPRPAKPALALAALVALAALPAGATAYPSSPVRAADLARLGTLAGGARQVRLSGPIGSWKVGGEAARDHL